MLSSGIENIQHHVLLVPEIATLQENFSQIINTDVRNATDNQIASVST